MYFCVSCNSVHEHSERDRVFVTGFRHLPNEEKLPLGLCWKSIVALAERHNNELSA